MELRFRPFYFADNKKCFYIPASRIKIFDMRSPSYQEELENMVRLEGRCVKYQGEEYVSNKISFYEILEKPMPVHFIIIRNYTSKLINIIRSVKPLMMISCDDDDITYLELTLMDDFKNPKIKVKNILTTKDVSCYKTRNKILEMAFEYYSKVYGLNESVFGQVI